ncbi:hypothetical protein B9Z55_027125 [Caenorhabditis nigoni]|uniref:Uncharacterized protein n=1 Tax=Caenorhabditis nigoni TaxID=1611254 RepID=A0A2G5SIR4_9PELO|nr:hypothetical protein B9Z55_027125 [Caenorhabditis nigoni]
MYIFENCLMRATKLSLSLVSNNDLEIIASMFVDTVLSSLDKLLVIKDKIRASVPPEIDIDPRILEEMDYYEQDGRDEEYQGHFRVKYYSQHGYRMMDPEFKARTTAKFSEVAPVKDPAHTTRTRASY